MTTFITPDDRDDWLQLRAQDITSTESAALFGLSPYCTLWELYHRKKNGELGEIEDNERMKWGRRLEAIIASGIAEDNGLVIQNITDYARHDNQRGMGASLDYRIDDVTADASDEIKALFKGYGQGVLEIKNVDWMRYRDTWLVDEDGDIEAPEHIELQFQHQAEVLGLGWGIIVPFVGGNDPKIILRETDTTVGQALRQKIESFWVRIDELDEPDPVFAEDAEFIINRYREVNGLRVENMMDNQHLDGLLRTYKSHGSVESEAKKLKSATKAEILSIIGDATRVDCLSGSVSSKIVGAKDIAYTRKPYRTFSVNLKKGI